MIRHRQRVHYEGSGIPGKVFSTQDASGQQLLQHSTGPSLAEMQSVMHKLGSLTPCPALAYQSVPWIVAVTHWTSTISMRWHARCALSTLTEWTVTLHEGMLHGHACTIPVQAADNTIQYAIPKPCTQCRPLLMRETTSPHDSNHLIAAQSLQCRPRQLNVQTWLRTSDAGPGNACPRHVQTGHYAVSGGTHKATGRSITLRQRWASLGTY